MAVKLDEIREAAQRVAASHGLNVVDLEFTGTAKERTLRISLEKNAAGRAQLKAEIAAAQAAGNAEHLPQLLVEGKLSVEQLSGITHEDCTAFSRDFGTLLDVEDLVPGAEYTLEASSPGLDRKLSRPEDFDRFAGCLVKVRTFEPISNNRHWQGRLIDRTAERIGEREDCDRPRRREAEQQEPQGRRGSTVEIALGNIEKANLVPEI